MCGGFSSLAVSGAAIRRGVKIAGSPFSELRELLCWVYRVFLVVASTSPVAAYGVLSGSSARLGLRLSQGRIESIGSVWQAGAFHFEAVHEVIRYGFWTMISLLRLRDYDTLDKEEIGMHYAPNRINQDAVVMTP
ncbi:hypothetical protein Bca101_024034 [Brassica carinata]